MSMRFEYFLTLMKQAKFIIGNSSAGIREAEVYGLPAIDIGDRQKNRTQSRHGLTHCEYDIDEIAKAIDDNYNMIPAKQSHFGNGNSANLFISIITDKSFWELPLQKIFIDKD